MQIFFFTLLFLLTEASFAIDCKKAITTPEINECASIEKEKVEAQLNETYKRIIKMLEPSDFTNAADFAAAKKAFIEAQRAWVKFREADCDATYERYKSGTIRTVM